METALTWFLLCAVRGENNVYHRKVLLHWVGCLSACRRPRWNGHFFHTLVVLWSKSSSRISFSFVWFLFIQGKTTSAWKCIYLSVSVSTAGAHQQRQTQEGRRMIASFPCDSLTRQTFTGCWSPSFFKPYSWIMQLHLSHLNHTRLRQRAQMETSWF